MTEMAVSPHLALDQSCYCASFRAYCLDYKPAMKPINRLGNDTHFKTNNTPSAHLPYVAQ